MHAANPFSLSVKIKSLCVCQSSFTEKEYWSDDFDDPEDTALEDSRPHTRALISNLTLLPLKNYSFFI